MGWSYSHNATKESTIAELIRTYQSVKSDGSQTGRTIETRVHRVVGNHLWAVKDVKDDAGNVLDSFIYLALLQKDDGCWGYKDMDESMGPHYYDCPLTLLKLCEPSNQYAREWRERVQSFHAAKARQRAAKKACKKGATIHFKAGWSVLGSPLVSGTVVRVEGSKVWADIGRGVIRVRPRMVDRVEQ